MEISTFRAPISCSFLAWAMISSFVFKITPNISPSSWLFGLMRKGLYGSTFMSSCLVASTTILMPLPSSLPMMRW